MLPRKMDILDIWSSIRFLSMTLTPECGSIAVGLLYLFLLLFIVLYVFMNTAGILCLHIEYLPRSQCYCIKCVWIWKADPLTEVFHARFLGSTGHCWHLSTRFSHLCGLMIWSLPCSSWDQLISFPCTQTEPTLMGFKMHLINLGK